MTSTTSSGPIARRNPLLVTIDIIASVLLVLFVIGMALTTVAWAGAYGTIADQCGAGPYAGIQCNSTVLGIVVFALYAIGIVGAFVAIGMVIVNLIRKRYTFWWPLGALVIMIVAFYIGTWLVGMIAPGA